MEGEMDKATLAKLLEQREQGHQAAAAVRRREARKADTRLFIRLCAGLLKAHMDRLPPRVSSGLVEQQRLFRRIPR